MVWFQNHINTGLVLFWFQALDGVSSLSSRGSSGIAKSDSFEMTGRNHHGSNGNGNAKSALENP